MTTRNRSTTLVDRNTSKVGRPTGSRNKTKIEKAQLLLDESAENAIKVLNSIATNEESKDSDRINAAKEILKRSIAAETSKKAIEEVPEFFEGKILDAMIESQHKDVLGVYEDDSTPLVSMVALDPD